MIRAYFYLDEDAYERARDEARRQGVSFSELCRHALERMLREVQRMEKPWMRFVGTIELDDPGASESVDETIYGGERFKPCVRTSLRLTLGLKAT